MTTTNPDLVERLRFLFENETQLNPFGVDIKSHPTMGTIEWQEACAGFIDEYGSALAARIEELEQALRPFATVGRIVDGPFGPALFAEDDMAFKSGCAWTENGEKKMLTWGDFRRARSALGAS